MKQAWVENNTVRDVCPGNPAELFHPEVAAHYTVEVADDVERGAVLIDDAWVNPLPVAPPEVVETAEAARVSPVEFKLLWTPQERLVIKAARATDLVVDDLYDILEDPRLSMVDLGLQSTINAVDYLLGKLMTAGLLAETDMPARRAAILGGKFN